MKKSITLAIAAGFGLAACMDAASPVISGPLDTEAAFRAAIAGKTLNYQGNTITINADNTLSGPWDGSGVTGTWFWEDTYWCRDIALGGEARPRDCQSWSINGNVVTIIRNRGAGAAFEYLIE